MPSIVKFKERSVIRQECQAPERRRERVNDATRKQYGIPGVHNDRAKLPRLFHIRQVMKQADARRDHEQPIRELVTYGGGTSVPVATFYFAVARARTSRRTVTLISPG